MAPQRKSHKKQKIKRAQHDDEDLKKKPTSNSPPSLLLLGAVLSLIVAAAVAWVQQNRHFYIGSFADDDVFNAPVNKTTLSQLFQLACNPGKGRSVPLVQCNDYLLDLHDENRTLYSLDHHKSGTGLQQGWKILDIPRNLQLWTIDALRDPSVQPIMLSVKDQLSPRAYLALYLSILTKRTRGMRPDQTWSQKERFLHAYLNYLPSHDDFAQFHPVLVMDGETLDQGHAVFYTDHLVGQLKAQIKAEYEAFCQATSSRTGQIIEIRNRNDVVKYITYQDYVTARLQVQTRSFTAGPLNRHDVSPEELTIFGQHIKAGNLLSNDGALRTALASAMVPLLDAFDHHAEPNIGWKYVEGSGESSNTSSFAVFAAKDISGGMQLRDTYGTHTPDSKIFAQYGFLNDDGIGRRAAILTPFHRILISATAKQAQEHSLLRYVGYDDGYERCIRSLKTSHANNMWESDQQKVKAAKMGVLKVLANQESMWVASLPGPARRMAVDGNVQLAEDGIQNLLSLCRLLALTHYDYDGNGLQVLEMIQNGLDTGRLDLAAFKMNPGSDSMEFRSYHWMQRLANETLIRLEASQERLPATEDRNQYSTVIAARQVRLGEIETIKLLHEYGKQQAKKRSNNSHEMRGNEDHFIVREKPCLAS